MTEETKARNELTDAMESIVERWELFAEVYHGKEYADGEHAYGVLDIEFQEAVDRATRVAECIKEFKEDHVMQHNYAGSRKLMQELFDQARFAAEEFAQIAAVALKTAGSAFVYKECDRE